MPNINSLTYNGMKSTDLGVYVTGSGSFDAAEMDADKYEIAGRNGDLIIPKNRYKNIVVTYPAFIPKAFQEKAQSIRNWMRSAKAYARLEDTYDMEHYRLGLASGIQSFEPVNRNDASNFQLSFDCKPQRFLKTGETPLPIEPEAHSYSGEIVSFETVAVDDMTKAEVSLSPIQSLNGYDHPWAGGAGKNKLAPWITSQTLNDIIWTANADGSAKASGTANGSSQPFSPNIVLPNGSYIISGCPSGGSSSTYFIRVLAYNSGGTLVDNWSDYGSGASFTIDSTIDHIRVFASVNNGVTAPSGTWYPMIRLASVTDGTFAPYENLCPISGHTGATLNVTGKNLYDLSKQVTEPHNTRLIVDLKHNTDYVFITNKVITGLYASYSDADVCPSATNLSLWSSIGQIYSNTALAFNSGSHKWYLLSTYEQDGVQERLYQLEVGSTATAYAPYVGSQYTSSFGQTVYGGTFDFVSGDGQSEMASVDLGTLTYTYMSLSGGRNAFVAHIDGIVPHASNNVPINAISSAYKAVSYNSSWVNGDMSYTRNATGDDDKQQVTFINNSYTDAAAFKTAMNGQTLCYELATPIEIDLDPTEVQTLVGTNNVWASDGTVEINYADPFNVDNPTYFEARPLFEITNPAQNDVLNVNGKTITFLSSYTGTVTIDCETMDCFSGYTNLNYLISATDFTVLNEGLNIVTWSGTGSCKMTPRWWEL